MSEHKLKKTIACSLITFALAGTYSSFASAHGYVNDPPSRSKWLYDNGYSDKVAWEPHGVEGFKYPAGSSSESSASAGVEFPPDAGMIPSGGSLNVHKYGFMNNELAIAGGWHETKIKAGNHAFKWTFTAPHPVTYFAYFITNQNWANGGSPKTLTREMFGTEPFCRIDGNRATSSNFTVQNCNIPDRKGSQKIYAIWRVADTDKAFYQIIDVKFDGSAPDVEAPVASVPANQDVMGSNSGSAIFDLDGSKSTGVHGSSFVWKSNTAGFYLQASQGSGWKNEIAGMPKVRALFPEGKFGKAEYELFVTNSAGKTTSKKVTLTVKKPEVAQKPDLSVVNGYVKGQQSTSSQGITLDASKVKHATHFKWEVIQGGPAFQLQAKSGDTTHSTLSGNTLNAPRAWVKANHTGKGKYRLTVTDAKGDIYTKEITVDVAAATQAQPDAVISFVNGDTISTGGAASVMLSAMGSTLADGSKVDRDNTQYEWSVGKNGNKIAFNGSNGPSAIVKSLTSTITENFDVEVQLKITDLKTKTSHVTVGTVKVRR